MNLNLTKTKIRSLVFLGILFGCAYNSYTDSTQAPTGYTNAPSESNCTSCHNTSSLLTSGSNWDNISLSSTIPATGYVPDSTYTMTLSHTQSGIARFGFSITALNSSNTKMGVLSLISTSTTNLSTGSRDYVGHKSAGTFGSGSISWSFKWKAPSSASGNVTFYSCVNSTNNNNNSNGDQIFAKTFSFSQSSLLPSASITKSASSLCTGDTLFLQGSGNNNPTQYTWTLTGGNPSSSTQQNPYLIYSTPGSYNISLTTKNGIGTSSPASTSVTVNAKPGSGVTVSGSLNFCPGDSVKLSAASSGNTYSWSHGPTTASVTIKTAGSYVLTVTNPGTGCTNKSAAQVVSLFTPPIVSISSSRSNDSLCQGDSIKFTATTGMVSYIFKDNNSLLQNTASNTYVATILSPANKIYVIAKDNNGCFSNPQDSIHTFIATRLQAPGLNCGTSTTSSVAFNWTVVNNATGYEISLDTGKTWNSPSSGSTGLSHSISGLNFSHQVPLMVRAKNGGPCFTGISSSKTCSTLSCSGITYNLFSGGSSGICKGESTSIQLTNISKKEFSINFNNEGYKKDSSFIVNPDTSKTYQVLILDSTALNCPPIQDQITINVFYKVNPVISTGSATNTFCDGDSLTLSTQAGQPYYAFIRNVNDTLYSGSASNIKTALPQSGDSIFVYVKGPGICPSSSVRIKVIRNPLPGTSISSSSASNSFCAGDSLKLTGSGSYPVYTFLRNSNEILHTGSSSSFASYLLHTGDQVFVKATDTNGCSGISQKITVTQLVKPATGFTISRTSPFLYTFTDTTSGISARVWNFGDGNGDVLTSISHTYAALGSYQVQLEATHTNGCRNTAQQTLNASIGTDIRAIHEEELILYPNPANRQLFIYLIKETKEIIEILDATGRRINIDPSPIPGNEPAYQLNIEELPAGVYLVKIQEGNRTLIKKFIKSAF